MVTYYFFDEDSSNVTFPSNEMGILRIDLNNINFDDNNFYQDDPEFIVHVRVMAQRNRLKQREAFKKDIGKELIRR